MLALPYEAQRDSITNFADVPLKEEITSPVHELIFEMSIIPMLIQDFFSLLLRSQAHSAGNISLFFDDLRQHLNYRKIVLDTASTHSLYLLRRDLGTRPETQIEQFNFVLDNLSELNEDKVIIHMIFFKSESYLFFTSEDLTQYLGYIGFPNNDVIEN